MWIRLIPFVTWMSTWTSFTPGSLGGWKTTFKGGGLSGAMAEKRRLAGGAEAPCIGPHQRSSHHPPRPPPTKDADDADGLHSDPSGELCSASILALRAVQGILLGWSWRQSRVRGRRWSSGTRSGTTSPVAGQIS